MIGGMRYVASCLREPPPRTTASFRSRPPRRGPHQVGDVPVAGTRQADVPVVALVGVEAEDPEEEAQPWNGWYAAMMFRSTDTSATVVHYRRRRRHPPTDPDTPRPPSSRRRIDWSSQKHTWKEHRHRWKHLAGAVGVVGIRVHRSRNVSGRSLPQVHDRDSHHHRSSRSPPIPPPHAPPRQRKAKAFAIPRSPSFLAGGDDASRRVPDGGEGGLFHELAPRTSA